MPPRQCSGHQQPRRRTRSNTYVGRDELLDDIGKAPALWRQRTSLLTLLAQHSWGQCAVIHDLVELRKYRDVTARIIRCDKRSRVRRVAAAAATVKCGHTTYGDILYSASSSSLRRRDTSGAKVVREHTNSCDTTRHEVSAASQPDNRDAHVHRPTHRRVLCRCHPWTLGRSVQWVSTIC